MFLFFTFCFCQVSAATHRLSPAVGEGSGRSGFSCAAWALRYRVRSCGAQA